MTTPASTHQFAIQCARIHVKTIKTALEKSGNFGKCIEKVVNEPGATEPTFRIWTSLHDEGQEPDKLISKLGLSEHSQDAHILRLPARDTAVLTPSTPLESAVKQWLASYPPPPIISLSVLLSTLPKRYTVYPPLLLLPSTGLPPPWQTYLSLLSPSQQVSFYTHLATSLSCTHVALNKPIPADDPVRKPQHLTPIAGTFPPRIEHLPTREDLDEAFWVRHAQNGITQVWAPQYSMFSRGNITEKARVLGFPDVRDATVVDMYAGIGYFTFSYVKAGARRVFAWEVNSWSVEGLRRGCRENGWGSKRVAVGEEISGEEWADDVKVVVFEERNENVPTRWEEMKRKGIDAGQVRHVNLGLLPTSRGSWETAAGLVSKEFGGWLHIHENFGEEEIVDKAAEARRVISEIVQRECELRHIERVKNFAPRVVHVVLDIWVPPNRKDNEG